MDQISEQLLEQLLKAMLNLHGPRVVVNNQFLALQDSWDLVLEDKGGRIVISTKIKPGHTLPSNWKQILSR